MQNIYYIFWADAISRSRKYHPRDKNWKMKVFYINTLVNAMNYWIIFMWLKYFKILDIPLFDIDIFPGRLINNGISFTLNFAAPFAILNYLLVFHNNRYKKILIKYNQSQRNYALIYSMAIIFLTIVSAWIYYYSNN